MPGPVFVGRGQVYGGNGLQGAGQYQYDQQNQRPQPGPRMGFTGFDREAMMDRLSQQRSGQLRNQMDYEDQERSANAGSGHPMVRNDQGVLGRDPRYFPPTNQGSPTGFGGGYPPAGNGPNLFGGDPMVAATNRAVNGGGAGGAYNWSAPSTQGPYSESVPAQYGWGFQPSQNGYGRGYAPSNEQVNRYGNGNNDRGGYGGAGDQNPYAPPQISPQEQAQRAVRQRIAEGLAGRVDLPAGHLATYVATGQKSQQLQDAMDLRGRQGIADPTTGETKWITAAPGMQTTAERSMLKDSYNKQNYGSFNPASQWSAQYDAAEKSAHDAAGQAWQNNRDGSSTPEDAAYAKLQGWHQQFSQLQRAGGTDGLNENEWIARKWLQNQNGDAAGLQQFGAYRDQQNRYSGGINIAGEDKQDAYGRLQAGAGNIIPDGSGGQRMRQASDGNAIQNMTAFTEGAGAIKNAAMSDNDKFAKSQGELWQGDQAASRAYLERERASDLAMQTAKTGAVVQGTQDQSKLAGAQATGINVAASGAALDQVRGGPINQSQGKAMGSILGQSASPGGFSPGGDNAGSGGPAALGDAMATNRDYDTGFAQSGAGKWWGEAEGRAQGVDPNAIFTWQNNTGVLKAIGEFGRNIQSMSAADLTKYRPEMLQRLNHMEATLGSQWGASSWARVDGEWTDIQASIDRIRKSLTGGSGADPRMGVPTAAQAAGVRPSTAK